MAATGLCRPDDNFDAMSGESLRILFAQCAGDIANNLLCMARIAAAAKRKGEDVTEFEIIIPGIDARMIDEGVMLPEVFVNLGGNCRLKRIVSALPPSEQRRLVVDKEPIPVAERLPNGSITTRMYPVEKLTPELITQVFRNKRILTIAEQAATRPEPVSRITINPADIESLRDHASQQLCIISEGDKRQRKKAARELCSIAERIAMIVN